MADLARALSVEAHSLRRFLILDCCFAESAYKLFQSRGDKNPAVIAHDQSLQDLPKFGTALLCSSSARNVSIVPEGGRNTMFTGALMDVLRSGDRTISTSLSLMQIGRQVEWRIREQYADDAVRPKVSSPDQSEGDIASIPFFPNPSAKREVATQPIVLNASPDEVAGRIDPPGNLRAWFGISRELLLWVAVIVVLLVTTILLGYSRWKSGRMQTQTFGDMEKLQTQSPKEVPNITPPVVMSGNDGSISRDQLEQLFPSSKDINVLSEPFRTNVRLFIIALDNAGATVFIEATFRPSERAYVLHYAAEIALAGTDPRTVPILPHFNGKWTKTDANGIYDEAKSRAFAASIVKDYGIVVAPSLVSNHTYGQAIDMTISWSGSLEIKRSNGTMAKIDTLPHTGLNQELWKVAETYQIIKLPSDPSHWSTDGR